LSQIFNLLNLVLTVLEFAIIGRALISWVDPTMNSSVARILVQVTEPIIAPLRRVLPTAGMIDFSPLVAILLIFVLQQMLSRAMAY
jgi:YggT family protein